MTIFYALLAALCNALNVIAQHLGSISSAEKSKGWRFVAVLLRNPMWLAGWGALAGGFVFQALALHVGQLSVVQPLLVTELVFALLLRRVWLRQHIRGVTWWAAALTCASLSVFLAMSEPEGGTYYPDSGAWATGAWGAVGLAAVLALLGTRGTVIQRTALLASAAAVMWALVATLVKTMTDTLTEFGVWGHVRALAGLRARRRGAGRGGCPPDRAAGGTAQRVPAVARHRQPDREHRAQRVDFPGTLHFGRGAASCRRGGLCRHVRFRSRTRQDRSADDVLPQRCFRRRSPVTWMTAGVGDVDDRNDRPDEYNKNYLGGTDRCGG